ncbi:ARM repeat-containing protein [Panus rudis PR-1116 ss-1]|nr:ARM repeat-containing protein [Panus rudis PR-1116 ss-1]
MGKAEIEAWIASTADGTDEFDDTPQSGLPEWRRELVLSDWNNALEVAQKRLLTSSTKARIQFLKEELLFLARHADLSLSQNLDIFKLLTQTYTRYIDAPSREAVEEVGVELVKQDNSRESPYGVAEQIFGWLANEVGHFAKHAGGHAPSDVYVLLSWASGLYTVCLKTNPTFPSTSAWKAALGSLALLLDLLLDPSSHAKHSLRTSALVRVRRALRSSPEHLKTVISTLIVNGKTASNPLAFVPLLGVAVDVTLRLKNVKDENLKVIPPELKDDILQFYNATVLMSRTAVPQHISTALHDFVQCCVTEGDLNEKVLPTMEKALLRSPEISLSVIADFFSAYSHPVQGDTFRRLLTPTLNSARSTNAVTRSTACQLFKAIIAKTQDPADLDLALTELLTLPKAGKTAGPDHRVTLYTMISSLVPSRAISPKVIQALPALLTKETHDAAVSILSTGLSPHLALCLREDITLPADAVSVIVKELNSAKPVIRRAFVTSVGNALWDLGELSTSTSHKFAQDILPALESSLKTVSANPVSAPAGPLEGYVAVALLLGPYARSRKFDDAISRNATVQSLMTTGSKPSFLLWDKVYQKLSGDDEVWLLRAVERALLHPSTQLDKNPQASTMLGSILLHLTIESTSSVLRRSVLQSITELAASVPSLILNAIASALSSYLTRGGKTATKPGEEESELSDRKANRLISLLLASATVGEKVELSARESLLVDVVVLAHHPVLSPKSRLTWIEACQAARVDPHDLVAAKADTIVSKVLDACNVESKDFHPSFLEASYRAVTTLAFVAPEIVIPRIVERISADLDPTDVNALTDTDMGIWSTPEGTTFIDVLANKKKDEPEKKGKGAKDAQWEAEVRQALANKKKAAGAPVLSKQDAALVQAQLEKEAGIRKRVNLLKARLERGLNLVHALVDARVDELRVHLSHVIEVMLTGVFGKAVSLVGSRPFEVYLDLSNTCSERLDTFRKWIGVATLRSLEAQGIPEEFQVEPINSLILRVLHRFRSLSEQAPFDSATYSYASPLLGQVMIKAGVGAADGEESLEQVLLALQIVRFHCSEFADTTFPRKRTLSDLLHVIRQLPKLGKEASSALVDLGQAIYSNVQRDEIDVLLKGILTQEVYVRTSCLQALQPFDLTDLDWSPELWIAYHDEDEQNARLAQHLWEDNGLDVPQSFLQDLLPYLEHENAYVRSCVASALAAAVEHWPESIGDTLDKLQEHYREKAKVLAPEFDEYGMLIASSVDRADPWPARLAIASTFQHIAPSFTEATVVPFFKFLIENEALGDRHPDVRRGMLNAGTAVIDLHGQKALADLISIFEEYLGNPGPGSETSDYIKEAVVILFGRVARHLDPSDQRIPKIIQRLVDALKTPSEQVQIAVSDCLSPLVQIQPSLVPTLIDGLFDELFNAPKYAARRGAAYGLAGVIKGAGISTMKEFNVIERLKAATEDKKRYEPRQGAMFAFETFSNVLGRLFEPYVLHILPLLLTSFGDATADVREATHDAARVIMGNLSGYGVKSILPSLLEGLDEKQWRSKKGSIELLGMMAYCAPRQLSQSLPVIIPRLTEVLTDSHAQVRTAANKSLKQFGEVISNPEIQSLVPVFLKALVDPAKTPNALSALLKTSFAHYIDHSSLALVVPIIERGLRERGAETKRKAAQIVGNLASLTDSKDFVPYLSELLPLVHTVLADPVPEARATAAKALGMLVERLGEIHFPDLVPGLLRTLKADTSGVDRQGAAQGLSEVLAGLGMERMEGLLPDIIANAQAPKSTVREGFMSLLVYLPATFGNRFQPHLPRIIAPILNGLSDAEDYVREAAMRAGRMIVTNYSSRAIDLLLPELERGMFDPGWRIRQASITLVGELLFKVSGISGKAEIEEDEEAAETAMVESSRKILVDVLGAERRDRILSALFLARQDAVSVVRQSSIHIWKALVHNTPRTVREILPELLNQIIVLLSSPEPDQNETAARTMAELCRKSGDKILGEIISILRSKANSTDPKTREGVCLTLCELMESTTETQREDHEDAVISMVRVSLVDDEANVRAAAARAFDILQEQIGVKAIDQTIPTLLEALRQPGQSSGTALHALKEVMNVRASTVFPVLIPTLTASPMTVFNARALASLVTVAGSALSKRLTVILNSLVKELEVLDKSKDLRDPELGEALNEALRALLASISDAEGLHALMVQLLDWAKHESVDRRVSTCKIFASFCEETQLDTSLYRVDWIRQLVTLLDDSQVPVHTAAWQALDAFVKSTPKDELEPLVVPLRRTIESTSAPGVHVPGFSLPKGVAPMVPIIIAGLTTGSNEQREHAAYAIGDLVERTEESAIKPFVVPFTGPLIRVATQATTYPPGVKTAILSALSTMLQRIPTFVKPFFPQLQRTFVKSASDPSSLAVRTKAAQALGILMKNQPRVDPVVTELITGAKNNEDSIAASLVLALAYVVKSADANIGEKAREACVELISDAFKDSHEESYSSAIAALFAALSSHPEQLKPIIQSYLVAGTPPSLLASQCVIAVLSPFEDEEVEETTVFHKLGVFQSVARKMQESLSSDRPSIARASRQARELVKNYEEEA